MSDHGRIHAKFYEHPKVKNCSLAAIGLWTLCNARSRDRRTGGMVHDEWVSGYEDEAAELCRERLWLYVEGGYLFNDWTDWNFDENPRTLSAKLVHKYIPASIPNDAREQLIRKASDLLIEGVAPVWIEKALKAWLARPGSGASLLPFLISDLMRENKQDDVEELLRDAWRTGDISKLARRGYIFTPLDDEPPGLDVAGIRAWNLAAKKVWVENIQRELKK